MAYDLRCKGVTVVSRWLPGSQPMALADSDKNNKAMTSPAPAVVIPTPLSPQAAGQDGRRICLASESPRFRKAAGADAAECRRSPAAFASGSRRHSATCIHPVTVDPQEERELEVFRAALARAATSPTATWRRFCRMISLWLRAAGGLTYVHQAAFRHRLFAAIPTGHAGSCRWGMAWRRR